MKEEMSMNQVTITDDKIDDRRSEAFKSLRTNLQFCGEDKKVIAIPSGAPNEGKSSVSMQLAVSLADSGKHVLMLDADLRNSSILGKTKVGKTAIMGLTHFLAGQSTIQEIICSTNVKNLHLIYSGPFPPNPAEQLAGKKFKSTIEALRKVYDYIIIDTPPLGSVIDGAIIAEICDGSILVIESGGIRYRFAQEIKEQLEKSNCPILGVVLNKYDIQRPGYGSYYGEHYGHYEKRQENKR